MRGFLLIFVIFCKKRIIPLISNLINLICFLFKANLLHNSGAIFEIVVILIWTKVEGKCSKKRVNFLGRPVEERFHSQLNVYEFQAIVFQQHTSCTYIPNWKFVYRQLAVNSTFHSYCLLIVNNSSNESMSFHCCMVSFRAPLLLS